MARTPLQIATWWSKDDCHRAVHQLENKIKNARTRLRNTNPAIRGKRGERYSLEYIRREIAEIEPVLATWRERLEKFDNQGL